MNIGIIGLGLMGSSMALALKKYCKDINIYGNDKEEKNLEYVLNKNIIDHKLGKNNVTDLDIIFIAVPVKSISRVINDLIPYLNVRKTLITDMGSTKSLICKEIKSKFPQIDFIGAHPMTGREVSGPENALADLFTNMTYIITDENISDENIYYTSKCDRYSPRKEILINLLNKIGCNLVFMTAGVHDKIVALTSHLPHFIAISLINRVINYEVENLNIDQIMGQGFRDFTRIAACSPKMWKDIFLTNRKQLLNEIDQLIEQMNFFKDAIKKGDEAKIYQTLSSANQKRQMLNKNFEKVSRDEF